MHRIAHHLRIPAATTEVGLAKCSGRFCNCARRPARELGHVALDGTKIKANASKHKAMKATKSRKCARGAGKAAVAPRGSARPRRGRRGGQAATARPTGEEMPGLGRRKEKRRAERIRKAQSNCGGGARGANRQARQRQGGENENAEGRKKPGTEPPLRLRPSLAAHSQRISPLRSRIWKSKDGCVRPHAQAAVDAKEQFFVAHDVTRARFDCGQMFRCRAIETNLGRQAAQYRRMPATVGGQSRSVENSNIRCYVATGRARGRNVAGRGTARSLPRCSCAPARVPTRVETCNPRSERRPRQAHRMRKHCPSTVVRDRSTGSRFRHFCLRGIESVRGPSGHRLHVHNLLTLALCEVAKSGSCQPARCAPLQHATERKGSPHDQSQVTPRRLTRLRLPTYDNLEPGPRGK